MTATAASGFGLRASGTAALAALLMLGCTAKRPASLGEAVGVEQPGGTVSQLIAQGSQLPTSATESFTTPKDDESRLNLHVVRGAAKSAGKLKTDGWWQVEGVSGGKAGEARVMVTFELNAQGELGVSAREEDRRLSVKKVEPPGAKIALAPLTEPDDSDDAADDDPD